MTKVLFTRKHIIISLVLGVVIIGLGLSFWGLLIQPKSVKVNQLKAKVATLEKGIQKEENQLQELKDLPVLLESKMVTEGPIIPNGMSLVDYFQGLAQKNSVSLQHMTFDDKSKFPLVEEGGPAGSESQLRCLSMSFDIVADTEPNLLTFVDKLENDSRFTEVIQVSLRHNPDAVGEGNYSYSATIILNMYYLSNYETGKPLAAEKAEKNN